MSGQSEPTVCAAGPEGCDPQGGELVRCVVCGEPVCDFHGDYADDAAHAAGEWLCPKHQEVKKP